MTLLATLVSTSQRVGATSARLAKVRELADALRALEASEIRFNDSGYRNHLPGDGVPILESGRANLARCDLEFAGDLTDEILGAGGGSRLHHKARHKMIGLALNRFGGHGTIILA